MSRGYGKVERYIIRILDQVRDQEFTGADERWGPLVTVQALAANYAQAEGVPLTPHLQSSFRRAAQKLADAGRITAHDVYLPRRVWPGATIASFTIPARPGVYRWVRCVAPNGVTITDDTYAEMIKLHGHNLVADAGGLSPSVG